MLSDELGQVVLLHSGMDDTHPITTPLSRAVVVKSRVGSGRVGYREHEILKLLQPPYD
jgi:hypothetical protein